MSEQNNQQNEFERLLEASLGSLNANLGKGDKVRCEVLTIGKEEVFVSVKGRDGVVHKNEMNAETLATLKVGDEVELYVLKTNEDLVQLSEKPSAKALAESLEDAFDFETPVEGKVTEITNGGFRVQMHGKTAFCPLSQMDSKQIQDGSVFVGKKFDFIITKFENGGRNIVVSRRKLLDQQKAEEQGLFVERQKVGNVVQGFIRRLEAYGAFVELAPGVEGLLHISEVSWSRIAHPNEVLALNDEVKVKILELAEDANGRLKISLSKKQVEENPLQDAVNNLKVGNAVEGTIKSKERFGFLVEIAKGVVGLLPKSAIKEAVHEENFEQKAVGEKIRVVIDRINAEERKISLSLPREQESYDSAALGQTKSLGTFGDLFKGINIKK